MELGPHRTALFSPVPQHQQAGVRNTSSNVRLWDRSWSSDTKLSILLSSIPLPVGTHPCRWCYFPKAKSNSSSPREPRASLKKKKIDTSLTIN